MKILQDSKIMLKQPWLSLWIYLFFAFFYASIFYSERENIKGLDTLFDSIYFSFVTITTLGYGDMIPLTDMTKFYVILESVAGVILLGFFLVSVSSRVVEKKERDRIESQKFIFEEQYKIWHKNTIQWLLKLTDFGIVNLDYELVEKLCNTEEFIKYFVKNNDEKWEEIRNRLSNDNLDTKRLLYELDFLQRNIEVFVMTMPIDNINLVRVLNMNIRNLQSLKKFNLEDSDEKKLFMSELWIFLTLWNKTEGDMNIFNIIQSI